MSEPETSGSEPESPVSEPSEGVRLQKVLARAGVASRRAAEELIAAGRVSVDGEVVRELGRRVDPDRVVVHVDGARVMLGGDVVHLALNKPRGVYSTMSDERGRPCVGDYVVDRTPRLFHVGRLDAETEGLLVLTNDGELAQLLSHPRYGVEKSYLAEVEGVPSPATIRQLREGVELEDGLAKVDEFHVVQEHGQQQAGQRRVRPVGQVHQPDFADKSSHADQQNVPVRQRFANRERPSARCPVKERNGSARRRRGPHRCLHRRL